MANNVVGEELDGYVNKQIHQRQSIHGQKNRLSEDNQYLNNRNAWVKLASGVSLKNNEQPNKPGSKFGKGTAYPMHYILFNGSSKAPGQFYNDFDGNITDYKPFKSKKLITKEHMDQFYYAEEVRDMGGKIYGPKMKKYAKAANALQEMNQKNFTEAKKQFHRDRFKRWNKTTTRWEGIGPRGAYDTSDKDFGIVPMPGIISADMKTKNRGSIKEANIKIKANSRRQFEIIEEIYLRLGYDMLLEWGWDKYIDNQGNHQSMGNTLLENEWFDPFNDGKGFTYWLPEIKKYREKYETNYDGAFMKVVNFNWDFKDDGTYDINLKLISHGDVIESLRTIPPSGVLANSPSLELDEYLTQVMYKDQILSSQLDFTEIEAKKIIEKNQINTTPIKDRLSEHLFNLNFIGYGLNNHINFKLFTADDGQLLKYYKELESQNRAWYSPQALMTYKHAFGDAVEDGLRDLGFSRNASETVADISEFMVAGGLVGWAIDKLQKDDTDKAKEKIAEAGDAPIDNSQFYEISSLKYFNEEKEIFFSPALNLSEITIESRPGKNQYEPNPPTVEDVENNTYTINQGVGRSYFSLPMMEYKLPLKSIKYEDFKTGKEETTTTEVEELKRIGKLQDHGFEWDAHEVNRVDAFYLNKFGNVNEGEEDLSKSLSRFKSTEMPCYVRFGYLLHVLGEHFIPKGNDGEGKPLLNINSLLPSPMYVPPNQNMTLSYKPSQFIIKKLNHNFDTLERSIPWGYNIYNGLDDAVFKFTTTTSTRELSEEELKKAKKAFANYPGVAASTTKTISTDHYYMDARNIYININYLINKIPISPNDNNESRIDIFGFIKTICTGINQAFGNVNNLEPIIDDSTNTLKIMDTTNFPLRDELFNSLGIPILKKEEIHPLQVYGYKNEFGNFVRKMNLSTTVSKEFAAMVTIGATAKGSAPSLDATAFSRFNAGKVNRFRSNFDYPKEKDKEIPNIFVDFIKSTVKNYPASIGFAPTTDFMFKPKGVGLWELDEATQNKNVRSVEDYFKAHEGKQYIDSISGSPSIGFLPFGVGLELDGISGIKIYNQLNINTDFLPSNYPKTLDFILKGVNHKMQDNDWVTNLETIACPKSTTEGIPPPVNRIPLTDGEITELTTPPQSQQGSVNNFFENSTTSPPPHMYRGTSKRMYYAIQAQSKFVYDKFGMSNGQCAGSTYRIAYKLKEHIETRENSEKPVEFLKNSARTGNANTDRHRKEIMALGLYRDPQTYTFSHVDKVTSFIRQQTPKDEELYPGVHPTIPLGTIYNYYAPNNSGNSLMHSQMWVGHKMYKGFKYKGINKKGKHFSYENAGWLTDNPGNYGSGMVYRNNLAAKSAKPWVLTIFTPKEKYLV